MRKGVNDSYNERVSRSTSSTLRSKIKGKLKTSSDWLIKFYDPKQKIFTFTNAHFSSSISLFILER